MTFNGTTAALNIIGWIGWFLGKGDYSLQTVLFGLLFISIIFTAMAKEDDDK